MSNAARDLMVALGKAADGYTQDDTIDATSNLLANTLRQKHLSLDAALEELAGLHDAIAGMLRNQHYTPARVRRNAVILHPDQFPELALLTGATKQ